MTKEKETTKKQSALKTAKVQERVEKISPEHLSGLQQLVNSINSVQFNLGRMEVQKYAALKDLDGLQEHVTVMQDTLLQQYGSYDVNVQDGSINWPPDKSPDSKDEKNPEKDEK